MPYFWRDDQYRHVTVNVNFCPSWMIWTWRTCGSNKMAPQATQRMSQSIYWKPSLYNVLSHKMVHLVITGPSKSKSVIIIFGNRYKNELFYY